MLLLPILLLVCSLNTKGQAPSITSPGPITLTQGIANTPVAISNTGGAVPPKVYGVPIVVPTTGPLENLSTLVKAPDGNFYGIGSTTRGIFKITAAGECSLYAGNSTEGYADGPALSARFMAMPSLAVDASSNLYICETNNNNASNSRIRKIAVDGTVSTFASGLRSPQGIAIDAAGSIYVSEASWIRKYSPSGTYTIFAGQPGPGYQNGQGANASFTYPEQLVFDQAGNLYVSEAQYTLRKITPDGTVSLVASPFNNGKDMEIDAAGNFYVSTGRGSSALYKYKPAPDLTQSVLATYGTGGIALADGELYYTSANEFRRMPIVGYGFDPALPQGVTITADGKIGGTPVWIGGPTNHTITAYNDFGSSSATVQITSVIQPVAPAIASFTPQTAIGGSEITINGSHFLGATGVTIGGVAARSFTVTGFNKIVAVMGEATPSGEVKVTNPYGTGTLAGFVLIPPPVITSFTPATGAQGTIVTITGENFNNINSVRFGTNVAASYTVISPTTITAVVGAGASGSITVSGAAGNGSKAGFEFIPPPVITSFTPNGGLNSEITIAGTGFTGATSVKIGAVEAASFTVISATSIKAIVGSGASGNITVTTPAGTGTRDGFTWLPAPVIYSFSPTSARQSLQITINGLNLENPTSVLLGGTPANVMFSTPNTITITVGAGASGDVTVTTRGGTATKPGFTFIPAATITSFTPASGHKGDVITITGTNFKPGTFVVFGTVRATSTTVVSPTTIEATVGEGSSGAVIVVEPTVGVSVQKLGFTHTGPVINSFTPQTGPTGTPVTISGQNFTHITGVSFGGLPAASFTVNSSTRITAVTGTGQSGTITVTGDDGTAQSSGTFQHAGPSITSFSPSVGYAGATVNITGTRFTGVTVVTIGGIPAASFTVVNDTRIDAVVAGTGTNGDVVLESPNGMAMRAGFTFLPPPVITSFTPTSAGANQTVTITGTNFSNVYNVKIGTTQVSYSNNSATRITFSVPVTTTSGDISVTTAAGTSTLSGFSHTGPKLLSVTPAEAGSGQTVTLTGENLTGVTQVLIGSTAATSFTVVSSSQITAVVPPNAGNSILTRNSSGSSTLTDFTYIPAPSITSFSPLQAGEGVAVTISGQNFRQVNAVSFGGVPAQSFVVNAATSITAIPAAGASGEISVTTTGGTISKTGFTWIPKPVITSFSPLTAASGATVTITGTDLNGVTSVKFGSKIAAGFNSSSATTLTAIVGQGETGDITVTTSGGTGSIAGFTHIPVPVITSYTTVGEGPGMTVTLNGTGFTGAASVKFGAADAASFMVQSPTQITAVAGAGETGTITVTTPGGTATHAGFMFQKPPLITSFSPANGPAGTALTITGSNFNTNAADNKVYFGTLRAAVTSASATELRVIVPAYGSNQPIRVMNAANKLTGFSRTNFRLTYPQPNPAPASLFSHTIELELQDRPVQVEMADLDGDGKNDLVASIGISDSQSGLVIFRNISVQGLAKGSFTETTRLRVNTSNINFSTGDVSGDGLPDIVCATGAQLVIYQNTSSPGNVSFAENPVKISMDSYNQKLYIRDLDLDGKCDILTNTGSITVFSRNTSTFSPGDPLTFGPVKSVNINSGGSEVFAAVDDLDGDGRAEIVMRNSYGTINVARNTSTPGDLNEEAFNSQLWWHSTINNLSQTYTADLDGDGKPEIVEVGGSSGIMSVMYNSYSSGTLAAADFGTPGILAFNDGKLPPLFADMDGDTKPDILNINGNVIKWLRNTGSPHAFNWEEKTVYSTGQPGIVLPSQDVGDLDGDGKPELAIVNASNYKIIILHTNPVLPPVITAFSPATAGAGATVTLTGQNLLSTTAVSFGGQPATSFHVVSSTSVTAVVGTGASGDISLTNQADATAKSGFMFAPTPVISAFTPATTSGGTTVTITGTDFTGAASVTFGGTNALSFSVVSPTTITAVVAAGTSGEVAITSPGGTGKLAGFTFVPVPVITAGGQTTFSSGGSVMLTTDTGTGYTYVWSKNGAAIAGASGPSYTATESGAYTASIVLNDYRTTSQPITVNAIFVLPPANFKLQAMGETCKTSNNGSVKITAVQPLNYTATLTGESKNIQLPFTGSLEIPDLAAGIYSVCITVENQSAYKQCYDVVITEPKDLSLYSVVNQGNNSVSLTLGGAASFNITLNGTLYHTSETELTLPLKAGINQLSVSTDKDCQGIITKNIVVEKKPVVYPNPFDTYLDIWVGEAALVKTEIRDLAGKLAYSGSQVSSDGSIHLELPNLQAGMYILRVVYGKTETYHKILRK